MDKKLDINPTWSRGDLGGDEPIREIKNHLVSRWSSSSTSQTLTPNGLGRDGCSSLNLVLHLRNLNAHVYPPNTTRSRETSQFSRCHLRLGNKHGVLEHTPLSPIKVVK